jgi:hypothetical protein
MFKVPQQGPQETPELGCVVSVIDRILSPEFDWCEPWQKIVPLKVAMSADLSPKRNESLTQIRKLLRSIFAVMFALQARQNYLAPMVSGAGKYRGDEARQGKKPDTPQH